MTNPESLPSPSATSRARRWGWLLAAAALLPVLVFTIAEAAVMRFDFGFPLDDSWIHLVFARSLIEGDGMSFNPGTMVTASTAPLWTALLSVLFLLPGSLIFWTKLVGVVCHLGVVHASYRLARELGLSREYARLATVLVLATDWLVWSALSGMEIPLFTWITLWGLILHLRERRDPSRPPLALGLFGLSILARPEGALLVVLAVLDRLIVVQAGEPSDRRLAAPPWRALLTGLALAALAALPVLLFQQVVGGSPVPSTFGAKTQGGLSWPPRPFDLFLVLGMLFKPQPVATLFAAGGLTALVRRLGGLHDRGLLLALWFFGLPLTYSLLRTPGGNLPVGNFGRYYFPLLPIVILLGVLGLRPLLTALGSWRAGHLRLPVKALAIVVLLAPTLATLAGGMDHYVHNVADVRATDVEMGHWIAEHLPPEALVAVEDVGAMKFFSPNRLLDMTGLITPEIRPYIAAATSPEDPRGDRGMLRYLEEKRPDFLITYPTWHPSLIADPRFRPIFRISLEDNITMGGDELFAMTTPWNRFAPVAREREQP